MNSDPSLSQEACTDSTKPHTPSSFLVPPLWGGSDTNYVVGVRQRARFRTIEVLVKFESANASCVQMITQERAQFNQHYTDCSCILNGTLQQPPTIPTLGLNIPRTAGLILKREMCYILRERRLV